jgi:gas vesicle protein
MFKLLLGAALGFAAAWFMDSKEGEQRRALAKDKASGVAGKSKEVAGKGKEVAGKGKEQALGAVNQVKQKASSSSEPASGNGGGDSYESATAAEPIAPREPTSAPGPETPEQS